MKNLVFVIWMLGFPIVNSLGDYLLFLREKKYSESTDLISSILFLVIWVFVGRLLYEEKSTKPAETKVPELAQEESEV